MSDVLLYEQQLLFALLHQQTGNQSDLFVLSPKLNIVQAMTEMTNGAFGDRRFKTDTEIENKSLVGIFMSFICISSLLPS